MLVGSIRHLETSIILHRSRFYSIVCAIGNLNKSTKDEQEIGAPRY